jgi:hypothetical protein
MYYDGFQFEVAKFALLNTVRNNLIRVKVKLQ